MWSTDRSPLQLVQQPLFGSQQRLLTVDAFRREAMDRGVRIDHPMLEFLHREQLLIPFFGIRYDAQLVRARNPAISTEELIAMLQYTATGGEELRAELQAGDLFDPTEQAFIPYRKLQRSYRGAAYRYYRYLYSPYQLLWLRQLPSLLTFVRVSRQGRQKRLAHRDFARPYFLGYERRNRSLLVPLHAVETLYRPPVLESVRAPDIRLPGNVDPFRPWYDLWESRNPASLLAWIGWTPDHLLKVAERLLVDAGWNDPLRDWEDLVALVRPQRWLKLKGEALVSIDHKIAGEMLLRLYEDLAQRGAANPLEPLGGWRAPRHSRLTRERTALPEVLTKYDLLPHPSVVLVVEGATEAEIMPRVLALISAKWPTVAMVIDAEGATRALDPLIAYVATPQVLRYDGSTILVRPPVRVLVAMDAEGQYVTQQQRATRRDQWVARVTRALPAGLRTTRMVDQLRELVEIHTWNRSGDSFEFAHWTDRQIARGILELSPNPAVNLAQVTASVGRCRARKKNLETIWARGWPTPHPKKPELADRLWPLLERRLLADNARARARVPAGRIARRVLQLARETPRHLIHQLDF